MECGGVFTPGAEISAEPQWHSEPCGCALMCSPAPAMDLALGFVLDLCAKGMCRHVGIVLLAWKLPRLMYIYFTEPMG